MVETTTVSDHLRDLFAPVWCLQVLGGNPYWQSKPPLDLAASISRGIRLYLKQIR
jgi:hypothetical protein